MLPKFPELKEIWKNVEGRPKGKHIYSLVIAKYKGDMLVYKGHVTTGVTREVVKALEITSQNLFALVPMMKEDVIWVKPNRVCIVEYMPNLFKESLYQNI